MASTRRLEIFQDPFVPFGIDLPSNPPNSLDTHLPPITHISTTLPSTNSVTFVPPVLAPSGRSPLKSLRQAKSAPLKNLLDRMPPVLLPPPQPEPFTTDSPCKQPPLLNRQPLFPPDQPRPVPTMSSNFNATGKENLDPSFHDDNSAEFPDPTLGYKGPSKRGLSEAAPVQNRQPKKPRLAPRTGPKSGDQRPESKSGFTLEGPAPPFIPEPQDMPPIQDDGSKPPYSYASLIGMAILRAPNRRLTLAQIYRWISDSFAFYRAGDAGWQNSIRHNLSLHKAFTRHLRPKDDPGKGSYWVIVPGMEALFLKIKPTRRPASSSGPNMKLFSQPSSEANVNAYSTGGVPAARPTIPVSSRLDPSSDATIPASDALSYEEACDEAMNDLPSAQVLLSSPLQMISSSPPVASRPRTARGISSVPLEFPLPSSIPNSQKSKVSALDDSGYFSAFNSSVTKPHDYRDAILLESSIEKRRPMGGRAEDEIARIRSSSHDISPTKTRSIVKQPSPQLISSSPLRHFDSALMLPPLTPAITFKPPPKPPASISPNTNLRNHRNKIRELVGSPVKNLGSFDDEIPFSPAFNIDENDQSSFDDDFSSRFDIFNEKGDSACFQRSPSSPLKRSIRRPPLDRANKSASILADVTGNGLDGTSIDFMRHTPSFGSPVRQKSSKSPVRFENEYLDHEKDDFFGLDLLVDDEPDDAGGLDLLQGFKKIGSSKVQPSPAKRALRPPLGARSNTSRF